MVVVSDRWTFILDETIERCYAAIDHDPQMLLETPGGPVGQTADIIHARLYGFDGQIDREIKLQRVEPDIFLPIFSGPTMALPDDDPAALTIRRAEYVLQSSYARGSIAAEYAPPGVTYGDDFLVRVLCVRYRRVK